jgi:hypothetical protein
MPDRFVYLIEEGGCYKIGSSADPEIRRSIVSPNGSVIHSFPSADSYRVESALHWRFKAQLIEGRGKEWFRLTPDDVRHILGVVRADSAEDLPPPIRPVGYSPQKVPDGLVRVGIQVETGVVDAMQDLARRNGRTLRAEIESACRRHLAHPPKLVDPTPPA